MNPQLVMLALLRLAEDSASVLEQAVLALQPDFGIEPDRDPSDPAARTLLYAADAFAFAITRYRAEHRFIRDVSDPLPF